MTDPFCDLCGLPIRHGEATADFSGRAFRFCCTGCKQVFMVLMESTDAADPETFRETELFKKCREMGIIPGSEEELQSRQEGPRSSEDGTEAVDEGTLSLSLKIENMWCPACAWVIDQTLEKHQGVLDANCNFSTDRLRCHYNPVETSPSRIINAIESLGYEASVAEESTEATGTRRELIRFALCAFLTMNVMAFSFALYSGFFTDLTREAVYKLSLPAFIMATVVLVYGGRRIYQRAFAGISSGAFSMESLITIGSCSAYLYSTYNLISGSIHLYYDTACMLITLVLLGKALETRAKGAVREDLENFFSLRPTKVRICSEAFPDGRYVAAEQLRQGDAFIVTEDEIVPADGTILEGTGSADESSLTGEALPVAKRQGDRLRSGTRVIQGTLKVGAEGVGDDATLGQMIQIMEKALGGKTPLEGKTDRALQWFVPLIIILALGTGAACLLFGLDRDQAVIRAVTVMVISCPCTLGVAVPLARVAGISLAGKNGILVRDFASFEQAERVNAFVFDKTGTVTEGQWELLEAEALGPFTEDRILSLACSLEEASNHYIALEIRRAAEKRNVQPAKLKGVHASDNGISGWSAEDEVKIGSRGFLKEELMTWESEPRGNPPEQEPGHSLVYMSVAGRLCAIFTFGDSIKSSASRTIRQLHDKGHRTALISGDGDRTTEAIGKRIGVHESHGGRLPDEKVAFIAGLQEEGARVAMVGDGMNDAPALVQAELGIAVHSGSHLGKEASELTLMRGDPEQILDFLNLAKRVNAKVAQNLGWSFVYNAISIPVAMSGLLNPLIAVSAMLMSSLSVIGNTLLLTRRGS